ncbi:MAG: hypothetical protein QUS14_13005 [Pyrinomonadaceae bacterium]|nr:hypothetical protein [Pyrinomonadaceae bacterium]
MIKRTLTSVGLVGLISLFALSAFGQKLKPEEILAKHLDSIAAAEKRAATTSIIGLGEARVTNITRKSVPTVGRIVMASAGTKSFVGMNFESNDNPRENIVFNGEKTRVDFTLPGARSMLGTLLQSSPMMIEQGLYTGSMSTNWGLLHAEGRKMKLSSGGTKKIDGVETHVLKVSPKGGGDYDIVMFFDAATFRHLRTEYKRTASAQIGVNPNQSSGFIETRIKITEDYSDFKAVDGYTLPHKYKMTYSISGQNGTTEVEWKFDMTEFKLNQQLADDSFAVN